MKPTVACSKMPTLGLSGFLRWLIAWRWRQRWMALRESFSLTQRRITFDDIVERQLQRGSQFAHQGLFDTRKAGCQPLRPVRAVGDRRPAAPAPNRGLADAEFAGQLGYRLLAALDVGSGLRGCGRIGMQS